ncbi:hypothetical protein KPH14_008121 [Odynerus spinipes]|uniref:C2H2-type domain-containing protein n=1 Tax=Odynerus spinipes TaxID=1348599 RepID=A0AAD9RKE9_9HYME|nr:hypothetical protein KPH14_008121 [Odynerus spinipes]
MANSKEMVRNKNLDLQGIIVQNDSEVYFCCVCNKTISKENSAYEHVNMDHHIKAMEIFTEYFQISKNSIKCKTCQTTSTWQFVQSHAEMHKLLPWCRPINQYKQCFENFLIIHEDQFYCDLCCLTYQFFSWHDILVHIKETQHIALKSKVLNADDIFLHDPNALNNYKCIVFNGMVYLKPKILYCWICDTKVSGITNCNEHAKGMKHTKEKLTFTFETLKTRVMLKDCVLKVPTELQWVIKDHNIVVFRHSLYCSLCDLHMTTSSLVKNHLQKHTQFPDIYRQQCKSKVNQINNTSSEEMPSMSNCSSTNNDINDTKCQVLNIPTHLKWIIRAQGMQIFRDKLHCKLCNVDMINDAQVQSHASTHFKTYKQERKKKKEIMQSIQDTISNTEETLTKSKDSTLENNEFVNVTIQDKNTNFAIDVSKRKQNKKSYNFDAESIFFTADEIKSSVYLCIFKENELIYCLICQRDITNKHQIYYDHIFSGEHLKSLIQADTVKGLRENLTKLALAKNGIRDSTDKFSTCMLCNSEIRNRDSSLCEHTNSKDHCSRYYRWMETCLQFYNEILTFIKNNWYYTNRYRCDICHIEFSSEICFAKHIEEKRNTYYEASNFSYHLCVPCGLLWYGNKLLYSAHSNTVEHKFMVSYGTNVINKFPIEAEQFLISCEENAEILLEFSNILSVTSIQDEILTSLKNDILPIFGEIEAYAYGSRNCGLGLPDSDINIFLDWSNISNAQNVCKKKKSFKAFIKQIKTILLSNPTVWDVEEIKLNDKTPIIKVQFIPRQLHCKISFDNALDVESTNLIKHYNEVCIPCRKLILILKQWLSFYGISGPSYISNYALTWCVIFYLQRMLILPSITELIQEKNKSKLIKGWQAGVSYKFDVKENSELLFRKLLSGFFIFYADFDYRCDVICPLLGEVIKKKVFTDPSLLPNDMAPYVQYVLTTKNPKVFCLSPMCVQDPFNLSDNLTAMVQKSTLKNFRIFCSKSVEILMELS